jgi:hypothetical protein
MLYVTQILFCIHYNHEKSQKIVLMFITSYIITLVNHSVYLRDCVCVSFSYCMDMLDMKSVSDE